MLSRLSPGSVAKVGSGKKAGGGATNAARLEEIVLLRFMVNIEYLFLLMMGMSTREKFKMEGE